MIWQRSDENILESQDVNKCHLGPDRQRRYQFSEKILGVKGTGSQIALGWEELPQWKSGRTMESYQSVVDHMD